MDHPTSSQSHDGAMRGRAWAIVKDGSVLRSGSEPSLVGASEVNSSPYFRAMGDAAGADLYVGARPAMEFREGDEGLIFGMTWEQLVRRQNRQPAGRSIIGRMPEGAALAYSPRESQAVAQL